MVRGKVIILTIVILTTFCLGQSMASGPDESFLLKLQESSIEDARKSLTDDGWKISYNVYNQSMEYFGYFLDFKVEKYEKKVVPNGLETIVVYFKTGIPNLILCQTTKATFEALLPKKNSPSAKNDYLVSISERSAGQVIEFRNYPNEKTPRTYSVLLYSKGSLDHMISEEKVRIETCRSSYAKGNEFFALSKYQEAIVQFGIAKKNIRPWDDHSPEDIDFSIKSCEQGIINNSYERFIQAGDSLFKEENYGLALLNYQKAQSIRMDEHSLAEKILKSENFRNVEEFRKSEHPYSYINPMDWTRYIGSNFQAMNLLVQSAKESGWLNYTAIVKFDASGNNFSGLKINSGSFRNPVASLTMVDWKGMPPSRISNVFIPTREALNFNLSWKMSRIKATAVSNELNIDNEVFSTHWYNDRIRHFIATLPYKNGIYHFVAVEKKLDGTVFNDLLLKSFQSNTGPANVFYSMIMPGWGTQKVTDGQKGNGKMMAFLVTTAVSIASKLYSRNQYDYYKERTEHNEDHYRNANLANKLFLISGGVSACIYLDDLIFVITRGIKNDHRSKSLRKELNNGPVYLVKAPLKP
jgi:hypothetical protein